MPPKGLRGKTRTAPAARKAAGADEDILNSKRIDVEALPNGPSASSSSSRINGRRSTGHGEAHYGRPSEQRCLRCSKGSTTRGSISTAKPEGLPPESINRFSTYMAKFDEIAHETVQRMIGHRTLEDETLVMPKMPSLERLSGEDRERVW